MTSSGLRRQRLVNSLLEPTAAEAVEAEEAAEAAAEAAEATEAAAEAAETAGAAFVRVHYVIAAARAHS